MEEFDIYRKNSIIIDMKKYFVILLFCFLTFALRAFAEEDYSADGANDYMHYSKTFEDPYAGQKQITDEEFQKTLEQVKAKQNRKKPRSQQVKPMKGKSNDSSDASDYIDETGEKILLLSIPLNLINGDGVDISTGHYKILATKEDAKVYLDFYQSSTFIARVPAIETNSDFDEKELNFVKLIPYNKERVKVIYGSMDLNAYTFIKIKN